MKKQIAIIDNKLTTVQTHQQAEPLYSGMSDVAAMEVNKLVKICASLGVDFSKLWKEDHLNRIAKSSLMPEFQISQPDPTNHPNITRKIAVVHHSGDYINGGFVVSVLVRHYVGEVHDTSIWDDEVVNLTADSIGELEGFTNYVWDGASVLALFRTLYKQIDSRGGFNHYLVQ